MAQSTHCSLCGSVCMCWTNKEIHIMLTYIMLSPLSPSVSHMQTCLCANTLKYTRLSLYNHCPTRREQMPLQAHGEAGTLTLFVCNGAVLVQTPFMLSSVQEWGNIEGAHSDFQNRGSWWKNMMTWNFCEDRPLEEIQEDKFFLSPTLMSKINWSAELEGFFPTQSPVAFFSGTMWNFFSH